MLDIDALCGALATVADAGQENASCEINGIELVIRKLSAKELIEVQKYAELAFEGGDDEASDYGVSSVSDFVYRQQLSRASYSIVSIGGQTLPDVLEIPGEGGRQERVEKGTFLRKSLRKWTEEAMLEFSNHYDKLLGTSDQQAESAVRFEPADEDTEIERLKARILEIEELKLQKKQELERSALPGEVESASATSESDTPSGSPKYEFDPTHPAQTSEADEEMLAQMEAEAQRVREMRNTARRAAVVPGNSPAANPATEVPAFNTAPSGNVNPNFRGK